MPKSKTKVDDQLAVAAPIIEVAVKKLFFSFNEADQDDARQEILVQLWRRKLKAYDPKRGPLTPWLWRVVKGLAYDQLNKRLKHKPTQIAKAGDLASPDYTAINKLAIDITDNPASHLKPKRARQLQDFIAATDDAPVETLAGQWGCSRNTADARIARLRKSVAAAVA